jgi:acyl phosphate:glycerol-3-phosphate acyltransferase
MIIWIGFIGASYLVGSIPIGLLLARMKGQDPRKIGSGNIGATNVMRSSGKAIGILTLLGDALKGFLPTALSLYFCAPHEIVSVVALAAFLGHIFPLYLKFKGGKGVATALGILVALSCQSVLIALVIFIVILVIGRYVSLGSMIAAAVMPFLLYFSNASRSFVLLCIFMAITIVFKHKENIKRLVSGKENKIGSKKK